MADVIEINSIETVLLFNTSKFTSVVAFGIPEELSAAASIYKPAQASIISLISLSLIFRQCKSAKC